MAGRLLEKDGSWSWTWRVWFFSWRGAAGATKWQEPFWRRTVPGFGLVGFVSSEILNLLLRNLHFRMSPLHQLASEGRDDPDKSFEYSWKIELPKVVEEHTGWRQTSILIFRKFYKILKGVSKKTIHKDYRYFCY